VRQERWRRGKWRIGPGPRESIRSRVGYGEEPVRERTAAGLCRSTEEGDRRSSAEAGAASQASTGVGCPAKKEQAIVTTALATGDAASRGRTTAAEDGAALAQRPAGSAATRPTGSTATGPTAIAI